jgi:hypothetical protein
MNTCTETRTCRKKEEGETKKVKKKQTNRHIWRYREKQNNRKKQGDIGKKNGGNKEERAKWNKRGSVKGHKWITVQK